eukprot:c11813_g1_i1.p2 GENE.c11813_g1_i1~~c11813_g1_i1.p2  ORF type:complete len:157 (-),score=37.18 c11813_g1_i1:336-806(-)
MLRALQRTAVIGIQYHRGISTSIGAWHSSDPGWKGDGRPCKVTFVTPEGEEFAVAGEMGQHLLAIAHENGIDLEGACEAALACSTCHVIVDEKFYSKIPTPKDEEDDMLDLAFGLTDTSRLGCQIFMTPALDGIRVTIPSATRNFQVEAFVPKAKK